MVILDTLLGLCICKFDSERISASPATNLTARHWAALKMIEASKHPNIYWEFYSTHVCAHRLLNTYTHFAFCKLHSNKHIWHMQVCLFLSVTHLHRQRHTDTHTDTHTRAHAHTHTLNNEQAVRAHQLLSMACGAPFTGRRQPSGLPTPS